MNQSIGFQLLQSGTEGFIRNAADILFHFVKPHHRKTHQGIQDGHLVFAIDERQSIAETGVGQLRTAMDRLFALEENDGNLLRGHNRACTLLMAAEGHGFGDVLTYYQHLMKHLHWTDLGHVLAGGNMDAGDIAGKPELEQAYALGNSIA